MNRGLQPALVDATAACYCTVETLTVVGGRSTRHCTQPEVRESRVRVRDRDRDRDKDRDRLNNEGNNNNPSKKKQSSSESSNERRNNAKQLLPPELIPGLPNDLAVSCLVRVPRMYHRKLRLVSRKWHRLLTSNYFFSQRIQFGMAEEWIYVIKRDRDRRRLSWHTFDPRHHMWHPLPPIPPEYSEALGFGCAVLSGYLLFLFGGKDRSKGSMKRVVYYSPRTNRWHHAPEMLRRRHFFGSCVINNCLYVAGGECEGIPRSLRSAEMFNPSKNKWCFVADMSTAMVPFIGVVYKGRWFLKGLGPHRQVLSEAYTPATDSWVPVSDGMVSGWRNPCVPFNGRLYALDCPDGCKLRVYDHLSDSWKSCMDSKLHLGDSQALEAAALLPVAGKLCIVRNNLSMVLVDVANANGVSGKGWETIAGKGHFKSVVSTLWSNISGRNKHKSNIVHCQVLQA